MEPANAVLLDLGVDGLGRLATKGEHALTHFLHPGFHGALEDRDADGEFVGEGCLLTSCWEKEGR